MNKLPTKESPNTLHYVGYITELSEPRVQYINGKSHIFRTMVLEDFNKNGRTMSAILLHIPGYFDLSLIKPLKENGDRVDCGFVSKVLYAHKNTYAMLTCVSIVPIDGFRINSKSIQVANRRFSKKFVSHKVDKDGYKFPYDY